MITFHNYEKFQKGIRVFCSYYYDDSIPEIIMRSASINGHPAAFTNTDELDVKGSLANELLRFAKQERNNDSNRRA